MSETKLRKRKPVTVRNQTEADLVRLKWRIEDIVDGLNKLGRAHADLRDQVEKLVLVGDLEERLEAFTENIKKLSGQIRRARKEDRKTRAEARVKAEARERAEATNVEREAAEREAAETSRERFKVLPHGLEVDGATVVPPRVLYEALKYEPCDSDLISVSRELPAIFAYETDSEHVVATVSKEGLLLKAAKGEFAIPFRVILHAWNASTDNYTDNRATAKSDNRPYCKIGPAA